MIFHKFIKVIKHNKYLITLTLLIIVIFPSILTSCKETDSTDGFILKDLLDISYENCLVCHIGGSKPITHHCIMYEDTSITQCVQCHKKKT